MCIITQIDWDKVLKGDYGSKPTNDHIVKLYRCCNFEREKSVREGKTEYQWVSKNTFGYLPGFIPPIDFETLMDGVIKEISGKCRDYDEPMPPHKLFKLLANFNLAVARGEKPNVALFWQIWKIKDLDHNASSDDL